ncbi:MAG: hypothetical protein AAB653_02935, partial [Patescibacteria group bacterium]
MIDSLFEISSFGYGNDSSNAYTLDRLDFGVSNFLLPQIEKSYEVNPKLEELRVDIGDDLFSLLSDGDKQFIVETEGIIDLGHKFSEKDFKRI